MCPGVVNDLEHRQHHSPLGITTTLYLANIMAQLVSMSSMNPTINLSSNTNRAAW